MSLLLWVSCIVRCGCPVLSEAGKTHEFRFVSNGVRWENAWNVDACVWNNYAQAGNSVVVT